VLCRNSKIAHITAREPTIKEIGLLGPADEGTMFLRKIGNNRQIVTNQKTRILETPPVRTSNLALQI